MLCNVCSLPNSCHEGCHLFFILASLKSSKNFWCGLHFIACLVFHSILQWKNELIGFQAKKASCFFIRNSRQHFSLGENLKLRNALTRGIFFEIICWYRASKVAQERFNFSITQTLPNNGHSGSLKQKRESLSWSLLHWQ